jgi:hypothetical protein
MHVVESKKQDFFNTKQGALNIPPSCRPLVDMFGSNTIISKHDREEPRRATMLAGCKVHIDDDA